MKKLYTLILRERSTCLRRRFHKRDDSEMDLKFFAMRSAHHTIIIASPSPAGPPARVDLDGPRIAFAENPDRIAISFDFSSTLKLNFVRVVKIFFFGAQSTDDFFGSGRSSEQWRSILSLDNGVDPFRMSEHPEQSIRE